MEARHIDYLLTARGTFANRCNKVCDLSGASNYHEVIILNFQLARRDRR